MGRAMVREPLVFLFDEPLSNLDAGLRAQMRIEIGGLQRRLNTTMVYVTHDQVEAMTLGDRIVVLANGRIQQIGQPIELYHNPVNRFVGGFIGSPKMNFVEGTLQSEAEKVLFVAEGFRVELPIEQLPPRMSSTAATLGVRPEDLRLADVESPTESDSEAVVSGRVLLVERLGGTSHVHLDVGPHRLMAAISVDQLPSVGDVIRLLLPSGRLHVFDADGNTLLNHQGALSHGNPATDGGAP
jgi:ABC-type sugar transport system ATPase subunit